MPVTNCLEPGCPSFATYRGRCAAHARDRDKETHHNNPIYKSARWKRLRVKKLREEPFCEECGQVATDADHRVPIEEGGLPFPPMEGLASLCHRCHAKKTMAEVRSRVWG